MDAWYEAWRKKTDEILTGLDANAEAQRQLYERLEREHAEKLRSKGPTVPPKNKYPLNKEKKERAFPRRHGNRCGVGKEQRHTSPCWCVFVYPRISTFLIFIPYVILI